MSKMRILILLLLSLQFLYAQLDDVRTELRYQEQNTPTTIDPVTVYDITSVRLTEILFGAMYSLDRFADRIPEFAESGPQLIDNNMAAIVKLKDNIKFSDGSPIRADDVVFTFKAATNPGSENYNRGAFKNIRSITKIDAKTIRIDFGTAVTDARKYLRFFIIPKDAFLSSEINRELSYCREPDPTSGAYFLLVRSGTGREYHFKRNPYYNGKEKPRIETIQVNVHHDIKAHADNLRNGMVDLIPYVLPDAVPQIKRDSRFKLELYDSNQYDFIAFNFSNPLIQLSPVRKAINLAFDREAMLESFFHNDGTLMSGPFPPSHQGNNPDVSPWEYDPNMAKTLLNNSGFVDSDGDGYVEFDGKPVEFILLSSSAGDATYNSVINSFVQQMKNIGLRITNKSFLPQVLEKKIQMGEFDLVYYTRKVTPEGDYSPFFLSSQAYAGGKNIGKYHNALVDSQFTMSNLTKDFQVKTKIYESLHEILKEDCPYVYLWYLRYNAAYIRELKNVSIDPYYFFTTIENWYFQGE